jgi:hypothetical protein
LSTLTGEESYEAVVGTPVNDNKTVYYYEVSEGVYAKYTDPVTAGTTGLFERYFTYTIPSKATSPDQDITGTYKAYVTNRMGGNVSKRVDSAACTISGPGSTDTVKYAENGDLPAGLILTDELDNIAVNFSVPVPAKTQRSYTWKFSDISEDDLAVNADLGSSSSIAKENIVPGWY